MRCYAHVVVLWCACEYVCGFVSPSPEGSAASWESYASKLYSVETTLYSFPDGKLVWMGRSQTIDPKNENKLADYSVNFAVNNMKKDGYIR